MGIIMDTLQKLDLIDGKINSLNILIDSLTQSIETHEEGNIPNKRPRSEVLSDLINARNVLQDKKEALTNQG